MLNQKKLKRSVSGNWQPDSSSKKCTRCHADFGLLRARHHCRVCGVLVCAECSKARARLSVSRSGQLKRVCDECAPGVIAAAHRKVDGSGFGDWAPEEGPGSGAAAASATHEAPPMARSSTGLYAAPAGYDAFDPDPTPAGPHTAAAGAPVAAAPPAAPVGGAPAATPAGYDAFDWGSGGGSGAAAAAGAAGPPSVRAAPSAAPAAAAAATIATTAAPTVGYDAFDTYDSYDTFYADGEDPTADGAAAERPEEVGTLGKVMSTYDPAEADSDDETTAGAGKGGSAIPAYDSPYDTNTTDAAVAATIRRTGGTDAGSTDAPDLPATRAARAGSTLGMADAEASRVITSLGIRSDNGSNKRRQWNSEFQITLELPATGRDEVKQRMQTINSLASQFADAATPIVRRIVEEVSLPPERKTIRPVDVGGVAGGVKFSVAGQFFKFSRDEGNLFGSDCFAAKAAGLELSSLGSLIGASVPGLHFPLMCVVDMYGHRMSVSSQLPIGRDTLCYGSADGGRTVFGEEALPNARVAAAVREVGNKLNVKRHKVTGKELSLAGDVEGHLGSTDARFYILDTQRCFPPVAPTLKASATHIPASLLAPEVPLPVHGESPVTPAGVLQAWKALMKSTQAVLGGASSSGAGSGAVKLRHTWIFDGRACLVYAAEGADSDDLTRRPNVRANALAAGLVDPTTPAAAGSAASGPISILGDAVLVHFAGAKREFLFELMRPEFVAVQPAPLSPDCFSGWGRDGAEVHNREARQASMLLTTLTVEQVASDIASWPEGKSVSAEDVKEALHARGVNMRYLGLVRRKLPDSPRRAKLSALLLLHVAARTVRRMVTTEWRAMQPPTADKARAIAARWLNAVLGHAKAAPQSAGAGAAAGAGDSSDIAVATTSDFLWRVLLKERATTQFPRCVQDDEKAWSYDLRKTLCALGPDPASWRVGVYACADVLCGLLGLVLAESAPLMSLMDRPVTTADIADVLPRVKHLSVPDPETHGAGDDVALSAAAEQYKNQLEQRIAHLGEDHEQVVLTMDNLARVYHRKKETHRLSLDLRKRALEIRQRVFGPDSEGAARGHFKLGLALLANGANEASLEHMNKAVDLFVRLQGRDSLEGVDARNGLVQLLGQAGNHAGAVAPSQLNCEIVERVLGPDHLQLAKHMNALALTITAATSMTDSRVRPIYDRALAIAEAWAAKHGIVAAGPIMASIRNNIAQLLMKVNDWAAAKVMLTQSLEVEKESIGWMSLDVARSLSNLAHAVNALGDPPRALELVQEANSIADHVMGADNPGRGIFLQNLGQFLASNKRYAEAIEALLRALEFRRRGQSELHKGETLASIGACYDHMEDLPNAIKYYEEGLQAFAKDPRARQHMEVTQHQLMGARMALQQGQMQEASIINARAEAAMRAGNYAEALAGFKELSDRIGRGAGPETPYNMACAYAKLGDVDKGIEALQMAVEWGFPHADHAAADDDLAALRGRPEFAPLIERMRSAGAGAGGGSGGGGGGVAGAPPLGYAPAPGGGAAAPAAGITPAQMAQVQAMMAQMGVSPADASRAVVVPAGAMPAGAAMSGGGAMPAGAMMMPAGAMPAGAVPAGAASGTAGAGGAPAAAPSLEEQREFATKLMNEQLAAHQAAVAAAAASGAPAPAPTTFMAPQALVGADGTFTHTIEATDDAERERLAKQWAAAGATVVVACAKCRQEGHTSKNCPNVR